MREVILLEFPASFLMPCSLQKYRIVGVGRETVLSSHLIKQGHPEQLDLDCSRLALEHFP